LEGAGHPTRIEIAMFRHDVFKKRHLRLVDKEREFPGFGEIGLGREQCEGV